MLVEADVTTGLLLLLLRQRLMMMRRIWAAVVAVVPIAGVITAVSVVLSLAASLLGVEAIAARPLAGPDVADRDEKGAAFGAAEEPVAFVGPVADSSPGC